jgi:AcrR family transcriptional regulator
MAAGAAVIAEQGYDAATMTAIAARAGASIGSLYQFFPTKPLLADALHAALLGALSELLAALEAATAGQRAAARVGALFDRLAGFLEEHPAFAALAGRRDIDPARKQATRQRLRQQIAALLQGAAPPVPAARAEVLAAVVLQVMQATVALGASDEEPLRGAARAELRRMLAAHLDTAAA